MNGDGIQDLITGSYYGDNDVKTRTDGSPRRDENGNHWGDIFIFYGNEDGSFQPRQLLTNAFMHPAPFPVDLDKDGDYDFVTTTWAGGKFKGKISLMENIGNKTKPKFAYPVPLVTEGQYASVVVYDWDGDGLHDLIAGGTLESSIYFFRNEGTKTEARFGAAEKLITGIKGEEKWNVLSNEEAYWGNYLHLYLTDWDGDGVMDILAGDNNSRKRMIYSLSAEEKRKVKAANTRVTTLDDTYNARRSEMYANVDWKTITDKEREILSKKADDLWKKMSRNYPTRAQDMRLVRTKLHLMGQGRIWLFRGIKE